MHIRLAMESDRVLWDRFVNGHPDATFFHKIGWRDVLKRAFNHKSYYLLAERDGAVVGVLPLARIKSRLFHDALISTPFCVYGGILAVDLDVSDRLLSHASEMARELGVQYMELRQNNSSRMDWPTKDLYVTFRQELSKSHDDNMKSVPRKQRAVIRKGLNADLSVGIDGDVEDFYRIYAESVRNLGTPVFSKRYVQILMDVFPGEVEIFTVRHLGIPVSSVMSFYFRGEVLPYYGGGSAAARDLKAYDLMYWELMRHAVDKGVHLFDFGRSKRDSGSYKYKMHWGFTPQPLHYQYDLIKIKEMPDISPVNKQYSSFIKIWKKLPLSVSRVIGPPLARSLG